MAEETAWQLDKKIPLAIIVTIFVQFVLGVWWAAKYDSRINQLETQITTVQQNYSVLNQARETALIAQTRSDDKIEQSLNMLRVLMNRSNTLHPEFQNDNKSKDIQ